MTTYFCGPQARLYFLTLLLIFGGATAFAILLSCLRSATFPSLTAQIGLMSFPVLCVGGMAYWSLLGLLQTFATYRMDKGGIVKQFWNGQEEPFGWHDLVQVETTRRGGITLIDFRGRRMIVAPPTYGYRSRDGQDLRQEVAVRLTVVQDNLNAHMAEAREFRNGIDTGALATGFIAILLTALGICIPFVPFSPPAPLALLIGFPTTCGLIALCFAYLAVRQATRVITLTATGITDHSLFGTREIPFSEIRSVITKDVPARSATTEWTTITGARARIIFSASLPNYDRLMTSLRPYISDPEARLGDVPASTITRTSVEK